MKDRVSLPWLWVLGVALGLLSFFDVQAGTITTTVKAPTKFTDGSTITAPIRYRLEGSYEGQPTIVVTSDSPIFVLVNMPAGHWCNVVYAIVDNVDADASVTACVTVPGGSAPPPAKKKPNPAYGISTTVTP